jgi:hypothetical protein
MSAQTLDFKRQPLKEMSGIFSANLEKISQKGEEDTTLWRLAVVRRCAGSGRKAQSARAG